MKSYFIFAIILTAIYVVYYAANIARDLYRKRSQGRTDEEVFEIDPDNGQDSVAVTESEDSTSGRRSTRPHLIIPALPYRTARQTQTRNRPKSGLPV